MTEEFNQIQDHLKSDKLHYIDVMNVETTDYVDKALYLAQIVEKHGDLNGFFSALLKDGINKLQVFKRRKHGSGNRLIGGVVPLKLGVKEDKKEAEVHGLNNAFGEQNQNQAMNPSQFGQEQLFRSRILDLEERIISYKQDLEEERSDKKKIRRKLEEAYDELRVAKVSIATSEEKLKYELLKKDAETKTFLDSENFGKLIGEGKSALMAFSASKGGGGSQLAAPSNNYGLYKRSVIEALELDLVTEDIAKLMLATAKGALEKGDAFMSQFNSLIQQFNINVEENV